VPIGRTTRADRRASADQRGEARRACDQRYSRITRRGSITVAAALARGVTVRGASGCLSVASRRAGHMTLQQLTAAIQPFKGTKITAAVVGSSPPPKDQVDALAAVAWKPSSPAFLPRNCFKSWWWTSPLELRASTW
jgi:hypothetical protein